MKQNKPGYTVGQRVVGTIEKLLPYGLFVDLGDGTRAYIRRRELTWSGTIDPRELWRDGDEIEGIVLNLAALGQSLELSHRDTLPDPWNEFVDKYQQGDVVEGTVKSVLGHGVFVEMMPGVDGLVPRRELATWEGQQSEDLIWVGDNVEAVITHLDRRTKKLRLSIRARLRQLEIVAHVMEGFGLTSQIEPAIGGASEANSEDKVNDETVPDSFFDTDIDPLNLERVGRILVIDGYDEIRSPLVAWLRHRGYEVDEARDAEEAHEKIRQRAYGLLFVDLNLSGMDGLTFLQQIRQRGINCDAAIMSTAERLAEHSCEIEKVGVIEAFVKPLELAEIEHLLAKLGQGETLPRWQMGATSDQVKAPESFYQLTTALHGRTLLADQFQAGLVQLVTMTPAEEGIIFKLNPISRVVSITTQLGKINLNKEAIRALGASPVRDVVEEGQYVLENQMLGQTKERFRKLLDLLPFKSCIGVPIETSAGTDRAVFLFHRRPHAFNRYHLRDTLATSMLLAVAIERRSMEHRFRSINKLLLSGQLAGGMSHEVYNKMSGLEIQLHNLRMDCHSFEHQSDQDLKFDQIQQAVERLLGTVNDLKETVGLFQQLMHADETQKMDINQVIRQTVSLLQPLMHEQKISLETDLDPNLLKTMGSPIQLQQVFLNIMINAIQQMRLKPGGGNLLKIETSHQNQDQAQPLKIRFSDAGPGIHRRLWGKIFDLSFTTRLGGTGQGLYIARSLVESLGGKISVERSAMLVGTTFLVELPIILSQGE